MRKVKAGAQRTLAGANKKTNPQPAQTTTQHRWYNRYFLASTAVFVLMAVMQFDIKLFLMGDDANYILEASRFIKYNNYPDGQSGLYAMILGVPVGIFGIHIPLLKVFSFCCAVLGFVFFYRCFYNKVPGRILYTVLLFYALNSSIQYYSSSNLSEAFFMMVQHLYLVLVFQLLAVIPVKNRPGKLQWLLVGGMGWLVSLSKNIAIVLPFALVLYFLLCKKWRLAALALGSFLLFKIPYEIMIHLCYGKNTAVGQLGQVMAKDLYHPEKGTETITGFIRRIAGNAQIYFSRETLAEFGFAVSPGHFFISTLLFAVLLLYGAWAAYKTNKYIFYTAVYTGVLCAGTFLALQPAVAQNRIIIIIAPLLLLLLLFTLDALLQKINIHRKLATTAGWVLASLICLTNFIRTADNIQTKFPVLIENLHGNAYYGYTPDWINYLEMGKWIQQHIDRAAVIAARKPNTLSVFCDGRPFYGIYSCPVNLDAKQLLLRLRNDRVKYLILASIRANPAVADPQAIVTAVHEYAVRIEKAYPGIFKEIHRIGVEEPCYLVEINYTRYPGL